MYLIHYLISVLHIWTACHRVSQNIKQSCISSEINLQPCLSFTNLFDMLVHVCDLRVNIHLVSLYIWWEISLQVKVRLCCIRQLLCVCDFLEYHPNILSINWTAYMCKLYPSTADKTLALCMWS